MLLPEFDVLYVTQKAIKGSVLAEFLAHQPVMIINLCNLSSQMRTLWPCLPQKKEVMMKESGLYSLMDPLMH